MHVIARAQRKTLVQKHAFGTIPKRDKGHRVLIDSEPRVCYKDFFDTTHSTTHLVEKRKGEGGSLTEEGNEME